MVAGLRGSSSGMPCSILPTRSAPTSAALVKMPPPTRMKRASSEPPNPNPIRIAVAVFWNSMMMIVAPRRPRPTVNMPATPPVRNATCSAPCSEPLRAAAAVRTLPRTARLMPMKPVRPDRNAPAMNAAVRAAPEEAKERATTPSGLVMWVEVKKTRSRDRDQDDRDGLELPPQVGHRPVLDLLGDGDHLRGALVGGEDAADQDQADQDGEHGDSGREDQPAPLPASQVEPLIPALGREDAEVHSVDAPFRAPVGPSSRRPEVEDARLAARGG